MMSFESYGVPSEYAQYTLTRRVHIESEIELVLIVLLARLDRFGDNAISVHRCHAKFSGSREPVIQRIV